MRISCGNLQTFRKIPQEDLFDVLDELQEDARSYDTFDAWFGHIGEVKQDWEKQAARKEVTEPAVRLSTLHGSKGLEFDAVFILDVDERVMPYKKAVLEADLEEERRMFYVGMTRADTVCTCSGPAGSTTKRWIPSRFLPSVRVRRRKQSSPACFDENKPGCRSLAVHIPTEKNSYIWSNSSSSKIWSNTSVTSSNSSSVSMLPDGRVTVGVFKMAVKIHVLGTVCRADRNIVLSIHFKNLEDLEGGFARPHQAPRSGTFRGDL